MGAVERLHGDVAPDFSSARADTDSQAVKRKLLKVAVLAVVAVAGLAVFEIPAGRRVLVGILQRIRGAATVEQRVAQFGPAAEPRLRQRFAAAGVSFPPRSVTFLGLKAEKELRVFASDGGPNRQITAFPILAASGSPGPKLREGDGQVPEGFYRAESLNPNSLYHLAIRVSYPSAEDREIAAAEGRTNLGGDIMIHGKDCSIGCLAMGDSAIEELFVLVARVGVENVEIVIAPGMHPSETVAENTPQWVRERYDVLEKVIGELEPI